MQLARYYRQPFRHSQRHSPQRCWGIPALIQSEKSKVSFALLSFAIYVLTINANDFCKSGSGYISTNFS